MSFNFKNPDDVKAYLENIYTEYRFGCDKEKNGNACHLLGDYLESITKDFAGAANIYKSNCDERNWPRSCTKFAGYKSIGKGCTADIAESYKYMKKGCDLQDPMGCVRAGILAVSPEHKFIEDRAAQVALGMEMLQKSCREMNQDAGCFYLSGIYLSGLKDEVAVDYAEAYKLSLISCDAGNPYACANIAQMYQRGEGVEKNAKLAESFKSRAVSLHKEMVEQQQTIQFGQGIKM